MNWANKTLLGDVEHSKTMSASGARSIARGIHSSITWNVAWDVGEDELLGMTLGTMTVALRGQSCLGPQMQVTDIERNIARVVAGDVPENIVEALLANCRRLLD